MALSGNWRKLGWAGTGGDVWLVGWLVGWVFVGGEREGEMMAVLPHNPRSHIQYDVGVDFSRHETTRAILPNVKT